MRLNDGVNNTVIRERCDVKEDVVTKTEKSMYVRWFRQVERMNVTRWPKEVFIIESTW